jgi:hypothetical protein
MSVDLCLGSKGASGFDGISLRRAIYYLLIIIYAGRLTRKIEDSDFAAFKYAVMRAILIEEKV